MRFPGILLASAAGAFVLPFFTIYAPYVVFHLYALDFGEPGVSTHILASARSISNVATAMACLASPFSFVPFVCPRVPDARDSDSGFVLQQSSTSHRVFIDQLVHYAPGLDTFDIVQFLGCVSDFASDVSDIVSDADRSSLLSKRVPRRSGAADGASVSSQVGVLSSQLAASLRVILSHIEITVARMAFIEVTISTGLSLVGATVPYVIRTNDLRYDRITALSTAAISDSVKQTLVEVDRALSLATTLSEIGGDDDRHILVYRSYETQARRAAPGRQQGGHHCLTSVIEDLIALQDALCDDVQEEISELGDLTRMGALPHQVIRSVMEAHLDVYRSKLAFLWRLRKAVKR